MTKGKKIALGIVIFFVVLVAVLAIIVPLLVDADRYRPQVAAYIRRETGKPVEIGRLTLTLFPAVLIRVDDFSLGNPPGFPEGTFVKARRIYANVDAGALWNRQVIIKSLELSDPVINLLSDVRGKWNFENPPKPKAVKGAFAGATSGFSLGVISKVEIIGGQLAIANLLPSGQTGPTFFEMRGVSSRLEQVDLNDFVASATASRESLPTGSARPGERSWGTSPAYAASPPPQHPAALGTLEAESLRFGAIQATDVKSRVRLVAKQVFFDDVNLDLYGGRGAGDLSFNFAGENPRYAASARATTVDVAKLLEAFPDARGKMTGKMDGSVKLSGEVTHSPDPLAGMRGTGQLSVHNGQLPSLQLNKNLPALVRLSNVGPASGDPSSFSSITADINTANQRITSNKITIIGNGVGVDGAGSLTLAGAGSLDYQGVAKIDAGQSALTNILVGLGGATLANGKLSFPFSIAGTLQNPRFLLKMAAGAGVGGLPPNLARGTHSTGTRGQNQPQPADLVEGLTDLFKKKQSQSPPKQ